MEDVCLDHPQKDSGLIVKSGKGIFRPSTLAMSYHSAREECRALGMWLPTFRTEEQYSYWIDLLGGETKDGR